MTNLPIELKMLVCDEILNLKSRARASLFSFFRTNKTNLTFAEDYYDHKPKEKLFLRNFHCLHKSMAENIKAGKPRSWVQPVKLKEYKKKQEAIPVSIKTDVPDEIMGLSTADLIRRTALYVSHGDFYDMDDLHNSIQAVGRLSLVASQLRMRYARPVKLSSCNESLDYDVDEHFASGKGEFQVYTVHFEGEEYVSGIRIIDQLNKDVRLEFGNCQHLASSVAVHERDIVNIGCRVDDFGVRGISLGTTEWQPSPVFEGETWEVQTSGGDISGELMVATDVSCGFFCRDIAN